MTSTLRDVAFHSAIGKLIACLDNSNFWRELISLIFENIPTDNWAALIFSNHRPHLLDFARWGNDGDESDPLVKDYMTGLYILDPFYIANREHPQSGLFHLPDIAPEYFQQTEYFKLYFTHYVAVDEVQFNVTLDHERTLCLSLGSKQMFTADHIDNFRLIQPWIIALMRQRMNFENDERKNFSYRQPWQDTFDKTIERLGNPLTPREMEVVRLVISGFSNKEIARKLTLSIETVKVHRRHIYVKLKINSQTGLFALFFQSSPMGDAQGSPM